MKEGETVHATHLHKNEKEFMKFLDPGRLDLHGVCVWESNNKVWEKKWENSAKIFFRLSAVRFHARNLHENGYEKLRESERNSSIDIQDFLA